MAKFSKRYSFSSSDLNKDDDGNYILTEINKDSSNDYDLTAILNSFIGMSNISLSICVNDEVAEMQEEDK